MLCVSAGYRRFQYVEVDLRLPLIQVLSDLSFKCCLLIAYDRLEQGSKNVYGY